MNQRETIQELNGADDVWMMHHSHRAEFRSPFGAVTCGQTIRLSLAVLPRMGVTAVMLRLWRDGQGEQLLTLSHRGSSQGAEWYETEIQAGDAGLIWYYFLVNAAGRTFYYGNNQAMLGGLGRIADQPPGSYQVTVYQPAVSPDWWKRAVIYQIFPDRFYNGSPDGKVRNPKPGSLLHACWRDDPFYIKDGESGPILAYDFFGGNLQGVLAKLPYLKDLGITAIYFNPIFASSSNHRYDTADYKTIDPMLGDNALFAQLCAAAAQIGIRVVLDGVFSHTGSDSIYFNKEGTYPGIGAYQSKESPYYPWYRFSRYPDEYESWWGVDTLPNVNEQEASYQDYIIDSPGSVVRHWARLGAKGWRLDVVDELPDEFVRKFREVLKAEDPDAVLIGEVWEDASRKESYGRLRQYFWGEELDGVMNYPFRDTVIGFLLGQSGAQEAHSRLMSLFENYPPENFYASMNLIGSHDVPRALTVLGEGRSEDELSHKDKLKERLKPEQKALGKARLKLAVLWQMAFPGAPAVYYGDETGLEGYRDPLNRRTYPWGQEDDDILSWYRQLIKLRHEYEVLKTGDFRSFALGEAVYGFVRQIQGGQDVFGQAAPDNAAVIFLNRGHFPLTVTLELGLPDQILYDMLAGEQEFRVTDGRLTVQLPALSGRLLLAVPANRPRGSGILLHPTSLPSPHGIGDLGRDAYRFIDWLHAARQSYWQILPLHPAGYGESPYQAYSAFAGNPLLISPEMLLQTGLLREEEIRAARTETLKGEEFPAGQVDFVKVRPYKECLLRQAYTRSDRITDTEEYQAYREKNKDWLDDYCLFMALSAEFNHRPWNRWPKPIAGRQEQAMAFYRRELASEIRYHGVVQYLFYSQWQNLRRYTHKGGIKIIGDLPLFVAHHSSDVWANPQFFALDSDGRQEKVAGVPPDYFAKTGQLWGNPQYRWDTLRQDDYRWWRRRIEYLLTMVDLVRIDHFRGFEAYWEVPAAEKTAVNGRWVKGPAEDFFLTLEYHLGNLPLIAEDLGVITPEVDDLKHRFGFPGMQVLHFAFGVDSEGRLAEPGNGRHTVLYTGTHDNDTTVGWLQDLKRKEPSLRQALKAFFGVNGRRNGNDVLLAEKIMEYALSRQADTTILTMQDILGLDSAARMNRPGKAEGNWAWRMPAGCLTRETAEKWAALVEKSGR
ncbi:bifunctional glycogen debranching protein GlgX/4-alpha-glucanotransferase [Acetonema longum]|uniref:4-alpha-glucanotransferase n=1 Tax=Acetonema longum DSM 6540 TaxID=1009370 RepID=F7NQE9_9FIRM|nr:bifunctional glycogen debranching protein GlgX/4-alpha-glucanotransferase [Acetonema longum]EGO61727.1 putative bifunctional 4-alpha-glucanotransferase/glycogen debranching enzyme [Acetonema longum DSM 6540]